MGSTHPTHRRRLARAYAAETGLTYQQALEVVVRASEDGSLPRPLDPEGMQGALQALLAARTEAGTPAETPAGAVPPAAGTRVEVIAWAVSHDGRRDAQGLIRNEAGEVLTIDDNVTVPPGTQGTVLHLDDTGTVFVDWDNGSRLGLIAGQDQYRIL